MVQLDTAVILGGFVAALKLVELLFGLVRRHFGLANDRQDADHTALNSKHDELKSEFSATTKELHGRITRAEDRRAEGDRKLLEAFHAGQLKMAENYVTKTEHQASTDRIIAEIRGNGRAAD